MHMSKPTLSLPRGPHDEARRGTNWSELQAMPSNLQSLVVTWHQEAAGFRRRGQEALAVLVESLAADLVETLQRTANEVLSLQ